jgi:rubrerythrin
VVGIAFAENDKRGGSEMTMKLGTLAKEALDFAIDNEEESVRFYEAMASRSSRPGMKALFEAFSLEEKGHKARLQAILKGGKVPDFLKKKIGLSLSDYLVDVDPDPDLDIERALVLAMKKETAAFRLYTDLAREADEVDLIETFKFLAQEELKHKERFEREFGARGGADGAKAS